MANRLTQLSRKCVAAAALSSILPIFGVAVGVGLPCGHVGSAFAAPSESKISDEQLTAFAHTIEKAMLNRDAAAFGDLHDFDELMKRASARLQADPGFIKGVQHGGASSKQAYVTQMVSALGDHGTYHFLRLITSPEGERRILFRSSGKAGLNYHQLVVQPTGPDGSLRVVDIDVLITGELISKTMERMFLRATQQMARDDAKGATKGNLPSSIASIEKMTAALQTKDYQGLLTLYNTLSKTEQSEKVFQIMRLQAAIHVDQTLYLQALEEYKKRFVGDPTADLCSLDEWFIQKDYPKTLEAIDNIDKAVGGDHYLDFYRSNAYRLEGKTDDEKKFAQLALSDGEPIYGAYDNLLAISARQKDHAETERIFLAMAKLFHMKFGDLKKSTVFADFVASPEYNDWMKQRRLIGDIPTTKPSKPAS